MYWFIRTSMHSWNPSSIDTFCEFLKCNVCVFSFLCFDDAFSLCPLFFLSLSREMVQKLSIDGFDEGSKTRRWFWWGFKNHTVLCPHQNHRLIFEPFFREYFRLYLDAKNDALFAHRIATRKKVDAMRAKIAFEYESQRLSASIYSKEREEQGNIWGL